MAMPGKRIRCGAREELVALEADHRAPFGALAAAPVRPRNDERRDLEDRAADAERARRR